jgi:DNA-binding MarR family transcriptional regulator
MDSKKRGNSLAFLLAQVGAHAAMKFSERLATLKLTPPDAGILRMLKMTAGISQQELSASLGLHPSRLVAVLDELERRGLLARKPNPDDRRQYSLYLTGKGEQALSEIGRIAREHEQKLCASLNADERERLTELLNRISVEQGLAEGEHPGYRRMRPR